MPSKTDTPVEETSPTPDPEAILAKVEAETAVAPEFFEFTAEGTDLVIRIPVDVTFRPGIRVNVVASLSEEQKELRDRLMQALGRRPRSGTPEASAWSAKYHEVAEACGIPTSKNGVPCTTFEIREQAGQENRGNHNLSTDVLAAMVQSGNIGGAMVNSKGEALIEEDPF